MQNVSNIFQLKDRQYVQVVQSKPGDQREL